MHTMAQGMNFQCSSAADCSTTASIEYTQLSNNFVNLQPTQWDMEIFILIIDQNRIYSGY